MAHTVTDHDGMRVLVVSDMNVVYDEEGNVKSSKAMDNLKIVHSTDIAKYYGIPHRSTGREPNVVRGVWAMVYDNDIGQRVNYNTEATKQGDRHIRIQKVIKDQAGQPITTEEKVVNTKRHWRPDYDSGSSPYIDKKLEDELDDGMYVKLDDLLEYAEAQGWRKGGGLPKTGAEAAVEASGDKIDKLAEQIAALAKIVAAVAVKK